MPRTKLSLRLLGLALGFLAFPLAAAAQEACTTYTVQQGDTLGSIAQAAYGSYDYQMIFNANRDALAANPNSLPPGLQLVLPCADGRLSPGQPLNTVIEAESAKAAADSADDQAYQPPIKFVTADDWAPFTDQKLTDGGIFVRMAKTAMERGGNHRKYTISWVDDWMSHVEVLLPSNAFDISIAWESSDCSKLDVLGEFGQKMCTEFDYSVPIYETAYAFNTLIDSKYAEAGEFSDYAGARICRPEAWPVSDLEVQGLSEPLVTFVHPKTPLECAKMLLDGEVDLYSIEAETATENFKDLNAEDKIVVNPGLATFISYHFITSKKNPHGREYLDLLDAGINEMRESGEWYDIVASGLDEFNKLKEQ